MAGIAAEALLAMQEPFELITVPGEGTGEYTDLVAGVLTGKGFRPLCTASANCVMGAMTCDATLRPIRKAPSTQIEMTTAAKALIRCSR